MSTAQPLPTGREPKRPSGATGAAKTASGRGRSFLSLVPPPVRARRAPFVALVLTLLAGGLVGLLLLNTASAQEAFKLHALQSQAAELGRQAQIYANHDGGLDDPATLYARAAALGLVPGGAPVFLKPGQPLPQGAIRVGDMAYIPAPAPVVPPPVPTPSASASAPAPKVSKSPVAPKASKTPVAGKVAPGRRPVSPTSAAGQKKPTTATTSGSTTKSPVTRRSTTATRSSAPTSSTAGRPTATTQTQTKPQTGTQSTAPTTPGTR